MRHNQKLTLEQLRAEAEAAVDASGKAQTVIAQEIGRSQTAISRAINEANSSLVSVQRALIAHLTEYEISEEPEVTVLYTAKRKS